MELTGLFPTEFDKTTAALLRTLGVFGVKDDDLESDMLFLRDTMLVIASIDIPEDVTMRGMDCAFIGLAYHRRMPRNVDDGVIFPDPDSVDYMSTLDMAGEALFGRGITAEQIEDAANEGAALAIENLRESEQENAWQEGTLAMQFVTMTSIGMVIHRLLPVTREKPRGSNADA